MDRCSGSERRPNLDHRTSNPSPHFDPTAGAFLRRPTVPRRLGPQDFEVPSTLARRPRSAFLRRSPTPACGLGPRPRHGRAPRRFPRDAFLLLHAFRAVSPLSATTQLCFRSGDRRTANPPPLLAHCPGLRSSASPSRHQPRIVWNAVPTPSVISRPASHRAYPSSALRAPLQVQFPPLAALTSPPTAPVRSRWKWSIIRMESSISPGLAIEIELSVSPGLRVHAHSTSLGLNETRKDRVRGVKRYLEVRSFW